MSETPKTDDSVSAESTHSSPSEPPPSPAKINKSLLGRLIAHPVEVRDEVEQRWGNITKEWDRIRGGTIPRYLFLTKILLLHTRYVFGYLAAGFLVSAPLYVGTRMIAMRTMDKHAFWHIYYSVIMGVICLVPFLVLIPVTRIKWENMRVPEFKIFELALTRWAAYVAFGYLLFCFNFGAILGKDISEAWLFDLKIAWMNFTLMVSGWARIKIQTIIFKDFYDLGGKSGLVLRPADESAEETDEARIGDLAGPTSEPASPMTSSLEPEKSTPAKPTG